MKLIKHILFQKFNHQKVNYQLVFSFIVSFIGLITLFLSILLLNDLFFFNGSDDKMFDDNAIIIQKKVTKFTSLGLNDTGFTKEEIDELKQKSFITDLAPFKSASSSVAISEYPGDGLPPFYSDMFFQSVPDRFLDVEANWKWNKNSKYVPIILPRQFLLLFNYGIAQSQGLPQVSEDLLSAARMKIHLKGHQNQSEFTGKVIGLSHKISSILVPESFLEFTNKKYGNSTIQNPQRLFITIKDGSFNELKSLMTDMNLDINEQDLLMSKIKTTLQVIITIFLILSIIIVVLAIFNMVQYNLLLLNRAKKEIEILFLLGYPLNTVLKVMLNYLLRTFGIITALSITVALTIKFMFINPFIESSGIKIGEYQLILTFFIGLTMYLLFIIFNFVSIKKGLKKL
jgi:hypothetical protein